MGNSAPDSATTDHVQSAEPPCMSWTRGLRSLSCEWLVLQPVLPRARVCLKELTSTNRWKAQSVFLLADDVLRYT